MQEEVSRSRLIRSSARFLESELVSYCKVRGDLLNLPAPRFEEYDGGEPQVFAWDRIPHAITNFCTLWKNMMYSSQPTIQALVSCQKGGFVSLGEKRRNFVSGDGLGVISNNEIRIWTDGGSFMEAIQYSDALTLMRIGKDPGIDVWLADNLPQDASIGVNSWSISINTFNQWEQSFLKKNQRLVPITSALVDPFETSPVVAHPLDFGGGSVSQKLKDLRVNLKKECVGGLLITVPAEVAWLYNIQGTNRTFAIVTTNSAFLCVVKKKVSDEAHTYFKGLGVEVMEEINLITDELVGANGVLSAWNRNVKNKTDRLWVDPASCCYALYCKLDPDRLLLKPSPLSVILEE